MNDYKRAELLLASCTLHLSLHVQSRMMSVAGNGGEMS